MRHCMTGVLGFVCMGKALQGKNVIEARELLREIVGTVRLE